MKIFIQILTSILLLTHLPSSLAERSFGLVVDSYFGCMLVADKSAPKEFKSAKGTLDALGNCVVSVPYNSPVTFCALTGVGGGGSLNKAPGELHSFKNMSFCSTNIMTVDENYKTTNDKSLWRVKFFAQKGLSCGFVCVEL